jgi:hypothetical protein
MNASTGLSARVWNGVGISRRDSDGYVNATAMCHANGKRWRDYSINDRSQAYIAALAAEARIPASALVHSIRGGKPEYQGTWIHPRLAVDLARWISPPFAVWMDAWFLEGLSPVSAPDKKARTKRDMESRLRRMDEIYAVVRDLVSQQGSHQCMLQSAPFYRYVLMEGCLNLICMAHGPLDQMGVVLDEPFPVF